LWLEHQSILLREWAYLVLAFLQQKIKRTYPELTLLGITLQIH
jgi:hypothetical protein